jgi:ATP-dependent DNA helicase RecQ
MRRGAIEPHVGDDGPTFARFEALRAHRLEAARDAGVPPYVIASDRTLRDLARRNPATLAELPEVHGIGPGKVERFGQAWLDVLARVP